MWTDKQVEEADYHKRQGVARGIAAGIEAVSKKFDLDEIEVSKTFAEAMSKAFDDYIKNEMN